MSFRSRINIVLSYSRLIFLSDLIRLQTSTTASLPHVWTTAHARIRSFTITVPVTWDTPGPTVRLVSVTWRPAGYGFSQRETSSLIGWVHTQVGRNEPWRGYDMETLSVFSVLCEGNPAVMVSPHKGLVMLCLCFLCCKLEQAVEQTFKLSVLKTWTWRYCDAVVNWTTLPTFRRYNVQSHLSIENVGTLVLVTTISSANCWWLSINSGNSCLITGTYSNQDHWRIREMVCYAIHVTYHRRDID